MVIRHDELSSTADTPNPSQVSYAELEEWCHSAGISINKRLDELTAPVEDGCSSLSEAMRYSLLSAGKRVRPLLVLLTAAHFGHAGEVLLDFGCALELVHCASLIMDDLPCMDDASMRRGQPACHVQFGEATASLAAIALLNQAFGVLARETRLAAEVRCDLMDRLSAAIGASGLVSGQCRDLLERAGCVDTEQMRSINHQKTGVLFELAVVGAATLIGLPEKQLIALQQYAGHVGQAFQFADDLLESTHHSASSGKDSGADRHKSGSVHALGESKLKHQLADELGLAYRILPAGQGAYQNWLHWYLEKLFARFG